MKFLSCLWPETWPKNSFNKNILQNAGWHLTSLCYVVVWITYLLSVKGRVAPVEAKRAGVGESPDQKRAVKRTLETAVEAGLDAGG